MYTLTVDCDWVVNNNRAIELFKYLCKYFKNNIELHFILSHQQAYKLINNDKLVNIDDHHDLGYDEYQNDLIMNKQILCQGNWINGLILYKNLKEIIWVKNDSSCFEAKAFLDEKISSLDKWKETNNLSDVENLNFDKIIICKSESNGKNGSVMFELLLELSKTLGCKYTFNNSQNHRKLLHIHD